MYMSRVELDMNKRATQRAFNRPQYFHRAIENCFRGPRQRRLWRLDKFQAKDYLIIVSEDKTDLSSLVTEFGSNTDSAENQTVNYYPFLEKIMAGQVWNFRLSANPVRAVFDGQNPKGKRGKIRAHVTPEQQIKWLLGREGELGVKFDPDSLQVVDSAWYRFDKGNGKRVTFRKVSFEGFLAVVDPDALRQTLTEGFGRQKAYGCGLLTLAPPR